MRKKAIPKISDLLVLLLMVLSTCGSAVSKERMQTTGSQATAKDAVTKSIERIIRETLKEGEGVVNGVRVWRRVPPAKRNVEEVRRFGDEAVPVLTNHLSAESDRERALAVEFLGLLGGRRIISFTKSDSGGHLTNYPNTSVAMDNASTFQISFSNHSRSSNTRSRRAGSQRGPRNLTSSTTK